MQKSIRPTLAAIGGMIILAACTQQPAQVVYKGDMDFARNPSSTASSHYVSDYSSASSAYSAPSHSHALNSPRGGAPVDSATVNSAGVQSIGVSDLAPPTPAKQDGHQNSIGNAEKPASAPSAWRSSMAIPAQPQASFIRPVDGPVITHFGANGRGVRNGGINIAAKEGEPVRASADGEVIYGGDQLKGYGNMVILRHSGNRNSTYAHLSEIDVERYQRVKQGDVIGYVGKTGNVAKPQLHFALREGTKALDPETLLPVAHAGL